MKTGVDDDDNEVVFDFYFNSLEAPMKKLLSRDNRIKLTKSDYIKAYTDVYDFFLKGRSDSSYFRFYNILGFSLHTGLKFDFFIVQRCGDETDEVVLERYVKEYEDYRYCSKIVNGICAYINRFALKRLLLTKPIPLEEKLTAIYKYAICQLWCRGFTGPVSRAILNLIERERNGESIETHLISRVINYFVEAGRLTARDDLSASPADRSNDVNLTIYKAFFEEQFLEETKIFYTSKSVEFLKDNSIAEYMASLEQWLREERERVRKYLHESTADSEELASIFEKVLVTEHFDVFGEGFLNFLKTDKEEDLGRVYSMTWLSQNKTGLRKLRSLFEQHLIQEGGEAIRQIVAATTDRPTIEASVKTIPNVFRKYRTLIFKYLKDDFDFARALETSFIELINRWNPCTGARNESGNSDEETPFSVQLAEYCDMLLKKNFDECCENSDPFETRVEKISFIVQFLQDRSTFQRIYRNMAAIRLLHRHHFLFNIKNEKAMLYSLSKVCDPEFTRQIRRMFLDLEASIHSTDGLVQYHLVHEDDNTLRTAEFHLKILPSIDTLPAPRPYPPKKAYHFFQFVSVISSPASLSNILSQFTDFYYLQCDYFRNNNHQEARQILWLPNWFSGEMVTNCFTRTYTLTLSMKQTCVLFHYNWRASWTIQKLADKTNIELSSLIQTLQTLLKFGLLKSNDDVDALCLSSTVSVSEDFRSSTPHLFLNNNVPPQTEILAENEQEETSCSTAEYTRKHIMIQIVIFRLVRSLKSMTHEELARKVKQRMKERYKPLRLYEIEECIGMMMSYGFIAKNEDDVYVLNTNIKSPEGVLVLLGGKGVGGFSPCWDPTDM